MKKIIRIAAVPMSLRYLLKGQLKMLNKSYTVIAVASPGEDLDYVAKHEGVQTKAITIARKIHIFKDLSALWQLYHFFKKEQPAIIHSITPKAGLLSMTAGYFAKVPVRMHTFTGLIFPTKQGLMKQLLLTMDKLLCHFATHVYPESQGVKNDLLQYKITTKPLKILANGNVNGVNLDYFDPKLFSEEENSTLRATLGITATDFVFVFVGRLLADKGINELIKAFNTLANNNNIKLLLVGPLEKKPNGLENSTLELMNKHPQIISTGWQEDIRPYLSLSDFFVFPSYREGMPNVVLQAGAMDLPQIVTNISGSNEIITHHVNGLIIPPKNSKSLQEAMHLVLNDKELLLSLSKNARNTIAAKYNQELVWKTLISEYQQFFE